MALTKCVRGCMARNDELPHSKNLIGKPPIRFLFLGDKTTYLILVSGLRQLVYHNHIHNLRMWFLCSESPSICEQNTIDCKSIMMIARKFARNCSLISIFTSGVSLCITTAYTNSSFRIARETAHNRSEFSCICERPLRIDAYCYIRQLQLTNFNCIIVNAFSLIVFKWNLSITQFANCDWRIRFFKSGPRYSAL